MPFNYAKLRGRIVEKFGSQHAFAKAMKLSERTMTLKLKGRIPWKQTEICKAIELLELTSEDIPIYFFTENVQKIEHFEEAGD